MAIERLTDTIIATAKQKAKEIEEKYNKQIQEIEEATKEEIERLIQENEAFIANEARLISNRLISNAQLKKNQVLLNAKWQVIDEIFKKAKQQYIESEQYLNFIKDSIAKYKDDNTIVYISPNDEHRIKNILPNLKYELDKNLSAGIIFRKGNIEFNYNLDKIVETIKNDIIVELSKLLFE
ncbi:MAG: V-type ATP synthase subunit E family protein [candidate division WOR-3 bacterium]